LSRDHLVFLFFFQAEDGIRDFHVTGVQTCALPIYDPGGRSGPVLAGSAGRWPFWPNPGRNGVTLGSPAPEDRPCPPRLSNPIRRAGWRKARAGPSATPPAAAPC